MTKTLMATIERGSRKVECYNTYKGNYYHCSSSNKYFETKSIDKVTEFLYPSFFGMMRKLFR